MVTSIRMPSALWVAKKSTNGPTTASKKPRGVHSGALPCITSSARVGSKANRLAATPMPISNAMAT